VTGVSGGGKSTFLIETLYRAVARKLNGARELAGEHDAIEGLEQLDKVIDIDQSPIGRTPRSNPATYTGAFTPIREWFAELPEAKTRGYKPGRFSFNVKGGRCEACQGDGVIKIEMHFLPDIYVTCDVCKGKRYDRETLEIKFQGQVDRRRARHDGRGGRRIVQGGAFGARQAADARPRRPRLYPCRPAGDHAVGRRGAAHQTVEGAVEARHRAHALYPRRAHHGLHFHDVAKLLDVLHELVDQGNTVVVIEHNLEVIKTADWIVDSARKAATPAARWWRSARRRRSPPIRELHRALSQAGAEAPALSQGREAPR
jgi:excinuclease ABC subunit A